MTEQEIVDKYLGVPYQHMGRTMKGADCYGLIMLINKDLGRDLFDITVKYDERWSFKNKNYFIENYHRQWEKVTEPKLFDVILFQNAKGAANHGGVVLSEGRFIQCSRGVGTVVLQYQTKGWEKRINGFYRYKENSSPINPEGIP